MTNKPLRLLSASHFTNSIKSHHSNSTTTGAMIASNINSELPLPQDEHTQVSSPIKSNSTQSSNTPLITPTSKPTASDAHTELHLMMSNLKAKMAKQL
eukprot:4519243-Ditylum_brightwellii.AAC.1